MGRESRWVVDDRGEGKDGYNGEGREEVGVEGRTADGRKKEWMIIVGRWKVERKMVKRQEG